MTQDTFIEILVDTKAPTSAKLLKVTAYTLTVLFAIGILFFGLLSFIFAVGFGVIAYFSGLRSSVEYEYSYMNKELDIDVIYSKQKRKHLATYDLSKMEIMAPVNSHHLDEYKNRNYKVCDYSSHKQAQADRCYAIYYSGEKKLIIEPTPQLIEAITYIAPRKVFKD